MEEIKKAIMEVEKDQEQNLKGDGEAVFLSDMSEEEYDKYTHEETNGWKGFTKQLKDK